MGGIFSNAKKRKVAPFRIINVRAILLHWSFGW